MQNQYQALFAGSFDTFKVFNDLTLAKISLSNAPKSIWQILNHLIKWQGHRLLQLKSIEQYIELNEDATWIDEPNPAGQVELDMSIAIFKDQHLQLQVQLSVLEDNDPHLSQKLKLIQELSVHLSFHVGELVLMRRMAGTYPLPHQMKDFLN